MCCAHRATTFARQQPGASRSPLPGVLTTTLLLFLAGLQAAGLQNNNNELVRCIEDLKEKREEVHRQINKDEEEKSKVQVRTDRQLFLAHTFAACRWVGCGLPSDLSQASFAVERKCRERGAVADLHKQSSWAFVCPSFALRCCWNVCEEQH